jgi:hypothetical protein
MRRLLYLSLVPCLVGWLAWRYGAVTLPFGAVTSQMPNPEDGRVTNGSYTSGYFGLSYPLPQGWTEGLTGPDPSHSGYYVLGTFAPKGERTGTILIAAQDMFFADKPHGDAAANDFRQAISQVEGMTIDREPAEVRIGDRLLQRVDFSGVGLYRAMFVAEIRCHLVSFNLTARDPELLASLALSLDELSFAGGRDAAASAPACVKNYAIAEKPAVEGRARDCRPSPRAHSGANHCRRRRRREARPCDTRDGGPAQKHRSCVAPVEISTLSGRGTPDRR